MTEQERNSLETKKLSMFETFVDDRIECFGVINTIQYLIDQGNFTKADLLAMKFDEEDIDIAFEDSGEEDD